MYEKLDNHTREILDKCIAKSLGVSYHTLMKERFSVATDEQNNELVVTFIPSTDPDFLKSCNRSENSNVFRIQLSNLLNLEILSVTTKEFYDALEGKGEDDYLEFTRLAVERGVELKVYKDNEYSIVSTTITDTEHYDKHLENCRRDLEMLNSLGKNNPQK
ncbi:MAG: hypothetical protein V4708_19020 [Bacteroidota bacterium]